MVDKYKNNGYNTNMSFEYSNNIIQFPGKYINPGIANGVTLPSSYEEIENNVNVMKQVHIQESIENIVPRIFESLQLLGFQVEDEHLFLKDGALIVESVRAFLYKLYNIEHPLHIIADSLFKESEDEYLEISDNIKIIIKPNTEE
jgi:hypothetical protein